MGRIARKFQKRDLIYVKYSNGRKRPCLGCHVLVEDLKDSTNDVVLILEESWISLSDYIAMITITEEISCSRPATEGGMKKQESKKLESLSIHPIIFVL